jgi:hypothetical protein
LLLTAVLGIIYSSPISNHLKKEIFDDVDAERKSHPKGVCNPNNIELGKKVKFRSRRRGWRIGVLVGILGNDDGRVRIREGVYFVRKLRLLFPAD